MLSSCQALRGNYASILYVMTLNRFNCSHFPSKRGEFLRHIVKTECLQSYFSTFPIQLQVILDLGKFSLSRRAFKGPEGSHFAQGTEGGLWLGSRVPPPSEAQLSAVHLPGWWALGTEGRPLPSCGYSCSCEFLTLTFLCFSLDILLWSNISHTSRGLLCKFLIA